MQIFLPFADFIKSLTALDSKRLGKQRIEAFQLWLAITNRTNKVGWKRHPLVKMWQGFEVALRDYICKSVEIFGSRKTKDGKRFYDNTKMLEYIDKYDLKIKSDEVITLPSFIGKDEFHDSHKAMLFHKGKMEVDLSEMEGKKLSNYYEHFKDFAYIKAYFWPVELRSTKLNTSEDVDPVAYKRKKRIAKLEERMKKKLAKKPKVEKPESSESSEEAESVPPLDMEIDAEGKDKNDSESEEKKEKGKVPEKESPKEIKALLKRKKKVMLKIT